MRHAQEQRPAGGTSPVRTLMVAWIIVVGLAFAPAGTYFYATKDYAFVVAAGGAALVIGLAIFIALGLARAGTRQKPRVDESKQVADLTRRGAVFGRR